MPVKGIAVFLALMLLLTIPAAFSGCETIEISGTGETASWEMEYSNFSQINISAGFDTKISRSDAYAIKINIDKALYEYLGIYQRGDTLHIGLKSGYTYANAVRQATITLPDLRKIGLSGASKADINDFMADHAVEFELSGTSRIDLKSMVTGDTIFKLSGNSRATGNIEMNNGNFNLSGISTLELKGTSNDIKIDASGGSSIKLADFTVTNAGVRLSSDSDAVINVSTRLDVNLSGASDLKYYGNPKLGSINVSGGSGIKQQQP